MAQCGDQICCKHPVCLCLMSLSRFSCTVNSDLEESFRCIFSSSFPVFFTDLLQGLHFLPLFSYEEWSQWAHVPTLAQMHRCLLDLHISFITSFACWCPALAHPDWSSSPSGGFVSSTCCFQVGHWNQETLRSCKNLGVLKNLVYPISPMCFLVFYSQLLHQTQKFCSTVFLCLFH